MPLRNPNISIGIELPPSELEETVLYQHPLIAACFFHPDHPDHLEVADIQTAVSEAEEMAAAAGFGF
mgnify:CR=1 FL=1